MPDVSDKTGIPYEALRKRAQREAWLVPSTAAKVASERQGLTDDCPAIVPAGVILAESIAEMGQKGAISVVRGLLPKIQETFDPSSALMQAPIGSWKDAGQAFGIFAKASGLDKPQIAIQNNVWSGDLGSHSSIAADETGQDGEDLDLETADGP